MFLVICSFEDRLLVSVLILSLAACNPRIEVIPGHSHNDYEQGDPLSNAIDRGFQSVEVDVHLIDDELYVYHDRPATPDPSRTLTAMYLDPLASYIESNGGHVYDQSGPLYLMIDVKTAARSTYNRLKRVLERYREILTTVSDGKISPGPVLVFISGNRPIQEILSETVALAALDGRLDDLALNISPGLMPVVSDNYWNHFTWDGTGKMSEPETEKLKQLVKEVHAQGKKIRFWGAPDNPTAWRHFLEKEVDLINTDRIDAFYEFLKQE